MSAKVKLELTGSMDQLRIVWQTGETLLESLAFDDDPESVRYNVLVSLQEIVTNVLRHGYSGDESQPLEVHFACSPAGVTVKVRDRGPAFNPLEHDYGNVLGVGDGELPDDTGGYGIMIAMTVMDEVVYERVGDWNELSLTKLCHAAVAATAAD